MNAKKTGINTIVRHFNFKKDVIECDENVDILIDMHDKRLIVLNKNNDSDSIIVCLIFRTCKNKKNCCVSLFTKKEYEMHKIIRKIENISDYSSIQKKMMFFKLIKDFVHECKHTII